MKKTKLLYFDGKPIILCNPYKSIQSQSHDHAINLSINIYLEKVFFVVIKLVFQEIK